MKLSIITPTHNTKYLNETYLSLKEQTDKEWEWLLVLNGKALNQVLPVDFTKDKRIKIIKYNRSEEKVGEVKKYAFSIPKEGILVELDHDDLLASNAVEEIKKAFKEEGVGFVYSDCAEFFDVTWKPFFYSSIWGWEKYNWKYKEHDMVVMRAFEPTPHSLSKIYYAPNHVRCWTVDSYKKAGRHDAELRICDDHDLLLRTYLTTKMKCIHKPLYLYRNYSEQSFRKFNAEIQKLTFQLYDKYVTEIVKKWCKENDYQMIDLGAAYNKPDGFTGVDIQGSDITTNLNDKWSFKDSSVGLIRANDIFEHLKDPIHVMNEAYRVLVDGGWLMIEVPSTDGRGAYQDPTHISRWNSNSFWYYTNRNYAKYVPSINCRFQQVRILNHTPTKFHKDNFIIYTKSHLVAHKNKRYPGVLNI